MSFGTRITPRPSGGPTLVQGLTAVGVTRSMDACSTLLGLALVPALEEANPVARSVFRAVGPVPGIVALSLVAILAVAVVTELGVRTVNRSAVPNQGRAVRYLGYGVPSVLSAAAAVHNVVLLVSVAG